MARRYTLEQQQFLRESIPQRSRQETAELFTARFGLTMTAALVKGYASNHKIHIDGRRLTEEQIQFIKDNGRGNDSAKLTELFNAQFGTSHPVAKLNTLRYKYGAVSGLKTRVPNSGRFQKGHVSHNKGLKQSEFLTPEAIERTKATRFTPGHTPKNHKPVGSERVNVYGYVEIKTAEPNIWELKHRVIWQQANGPLSSEDLIIFLDGDSTNCKLDNLALIDKSINARLNQSHLRSKYPEVTKVAVTLGRVLAKSHEEPNRRKRIGGIS